MQLLDALEIGAGHFNLSDAELRYLRFLFRQTRVTDWEPGQEPVVGWRVIDIAQALGKSERSICRLEAGLVAKQFIVHRTGARQSRYCLREHGYLVAAAGVSLAPLASRSEEILAVAQQAIEESRLARSLRLEITDARRQLLILTTATLPDVVLSRIGEVIARLPLRHEALTPLSELRLLANLARDLLRDLRRLLHGEDHSAPLPSLRLQADRSDKDVRPENTQINPSIESHAEKAPSPGNYPPEFQVYFDMARDIASPHRRVVVACEQFATMIGVSGWAVQQAIGSVGLGDSLTCLAIIRNLQASVDSLTRIRDPNRYFLALADRARRGALRRPPPPQDVLAGRTCHSFRSAGTLGPM